MTEATLQFLPIYHLVNGRYDRVPQAALHQLKNSLKQALSHYRTIFIVINMGLHYVDNPVAGFSKNDYTQQMTTVSFPKFFVLCLLGIVGNLLLCA